MFVLYVYEHTCRYQFSQQKYLISSYTKENKYELLLERLNFRLRETRYKNVVLTLNSSFKEGSGAISIISVSNYGKSKHQNHDCTWIVCTHTITVNHGGRIITVNIWP